VTGLHAGLAVWARRPGDVLRVAYAREAREAAGDLVRDAASRHVPCAEAGTPDLDRLAGSGHHEGLVLVTRPRRWASTQELGDTLLRARGRRADSHAGTSLAPGACIALDRVRNPYNVGAVLRSAAFFGIDAALLGSQAPHPDLPPVAVRVAEGGAEHLLLARTTDLADTLARLRARGVRVVGADVRAPATEAPGLFARPVVLVVGHEREGLGARVRAQCDALVAIRGSGRIESLNVGVASGVLLSRLAAG
jgi:TrmH RNA methyltransferase